MLIFHEFSNFPLRISAFFVPSFLLLAIIEFDKFQGFCAETLYHCMYICNCTCQEFRGFFVGKVLGFSKWSVCKEAHRLGHTGFLESDDC